ncbi:MAG: WHG domain-containing protein [Actinomycetes bacterium]|jgi:AcrR family transcriptional regulator|nr:WHG domain-containing protein [Actinomycetes bacterium]
MVRQRNLTNDAVMDAAVSLVEQGGLERLTISSLAEKLSVKPPSLYNHVSGIGEVTRQLADIVLSRMEDAVKTAAVGRSKEAAIRAIAIGYRKFALNHPELYRAFTTAPSIDVKERLSSLANTLRQVLAPFELAKRDETNFVRQFHASLHGFVALESAGFFQSVEVPVDDSFASLVDCQIRILKTIKELS